MPSITEMMSAILRDEPWMSRMVSTTSLITLPPWVATSALLPASSAAVRALPAVCCTVDEISSMLEADCCRLAAVCSVRRDRSLDAEAISELECTIMSADSRTCLTKLRKDSCI
jgi:hypothetical protein